MSRIPYAASVCGIAPALGDSEPDGLFTKVVSAIGSEDETPIATVLRYFTSIRGPRPIEQDDVMYFDGGLRFVHSEGSFTFFIDGSSVSVLLTSDEAADMEPESQITASFHLVGEVLSVGNSGRDFILETGAWSSEVCAFRLFPYMTSGALFLEYRLLTSHAQHRRLP